jgi:surfeit locus 1 family protein
MSRSRRWLLLIAVITLTAIAVRLGIWQLDRFSTRRVANRGLIEARSQPPLDLGTVPATAGRRAQAEGQFEANGQVLLRSRVHRAAPGVHVATPFRVARTGQVIWVLRGFVAAADGVQPDSIPVPTPGTIAVRGELHALPSTEDGGRPVAVNGDTTWQRFDAAVALGRRADAAPLLLYLEGGEAGPGRLAEVEPPSLDDGPHLSYAIQWFGIALAILAFGIYALRRPSGRERARPDAAP